MKKEKSILFCELLSLFFIITNSKKIRKNILKYIFCLFREDFHNKSSFLSSFFSNFTNEYKVSNIFG